jgi:long-chain fatty acid transport protein
MRKIISSIAVSLSLVFVGSTAMGAGFALYEFSARGNAMGGAVAANKAEAASLAVNPSLITQIDGAQVQVGATFVIPQATTEVSAIPALGLNDTKSEFKDRVFILPNFYTTYQASENVFLGLAGFSRFGLGGEYKDTNTWAGSAIAYKFDVLSYSVTPIIAAKVTEELSLAAGLEAMWLDFSEEKLLGPSRIKVQGDGVSWGGSFSAFYKPLWAEKWGFGLAYRTKIRHIVNGTADVSGSSSDVRGSVALPDSLTFGAAFSATDKLTLEAGIVETFWSSYDAIRIEDFPTSGALSVEEKHYKDVYRLNFGAEYALNNNWDIRGGYVFDKSPTNDKYMDTLVPVGDRHILNAGVGYKKNDWGIDFSYSYLIGKDMNGKGEVKIPSPPAPSPTVIHPDIKYTNADTHMIGITFKYAFAQNFLRGGK